jgi:hypothetical protein
VQFRPILLLFVLVVIGAAAAACSDDDDGSPPDPTSESTRAAAVSPAAAGRPSTVLPDSEAPAVPADAAPTAEPYTRGGIRSAPTSAAPTSAPAPPPTASAGAATITLTRFDCEAYAFTVESQPAALYKVHWTSMSPVNPDPVDSRVVSDAEVSQSPGEHVFEHAEDDWAEPGSNQLHIRAEDVDGATFEETRTITC